MSLNYSELRTNLLDEFKAQGQEQSAMMTREQIYQFFDSMSDNGKFDRGICEQLLEKIQNENDGNREKVRVKQLASVILQAVRSIVSKLNQCRSTEHEFKQKRIKAAALFEEESANEKRNEFNIMIGSLLSIRPIESTHTTTLNAQNSARTSTVFPTMVSVRCANSAELVQWGELTQFPITSSTEDISISVVRSSDKSILGTTYISLIALKNQKKINTWESSGPIEKLHVELQWIHSKALFLKEIVMKWDQQLDELENDIRGYNTDLFELTAPFKSLKSIPRAVELAAEAHLLAQSQNASPRLSAKQPTLADEALSSQQQEEINVEDEEEHDYLLKFTEQQIESGELLEIIKWSNVAFIVMALFLSFERAISLDFMIGIIFGLQVMRTQSHKLLPTITVFRILSLIVILSIFIDISWITFEVHEQWSSVKPEFGLRRAVIILSFLFLAAKVVLVGFFLYLESEIRKIAKSQQNQNKQRTQEPFYEKF